MEAINLDLLPGAMPPIVHVSQGDVGRQFKIAIYDDTGAVYSLTGKTLSIVGRKSDGNIFQYAIPSNAISGNEVTITTEEQMTPAAGKALCEIRIEQGGTKLGTCNFVLNVEQGPADMGSLSVSALYLIDTLFERAQEDIDATTAAVATATQKASEASSSATAAAKSASNAATKAKNAESSATAAASSATAAASSATAAATSATNASASATATKTSETNAAKSATAAAGSASDAATSKSNASTSAANAANSATAAAKSASNAATKAKNAGSSATAAANSANAAATSATNASASATAAAGSATSAATSESNAATSKTNATKSATAAANSATNAASSATAAANSATAAAASESKIADMTVSAKSVPYTQSAAVVKTEVGGVYNLDFKIPRGAPTSGHDVEANPTGDATGDLTKLGIDGTIYNIASGSTELPKFIYVLAYEVGDDPKYTPTAHIYWVKGDGTHIGDIFVAMVEYIPANSNQLRCPLYYTQSGTRHRISDAKYQSICTNWLNIPDSIQAEMIIQTLCVNTPDNICIGNTLYNDLATNKIVFSAFGTPKLGSYFDLNTESTKFAYYIGGILQSTNVNITNFLDLGHLGVMANADVFDA